MTYLSIIRNSLKFTSVGINAPDLLELHMHKAIPESTIHLWSARYSDLDRYYPILSTLISPDEITRASGFIKPDDTRRYILRRGMIRAILGQYMHKEPVKVRFIRGTTGKPALDLGENVYDIRFSLSHTGERVCLGISQKSNLGVDIVKIDAGYPFLETGEYLFSPGERRLIAQTTPEDRPLRFFRIWSVKEALLKATEGTVNMMKEAEVSGIMTGPFMDGIYTVNLGVKDQKCFIRESGCGADHHCALAAIPKTTREPDT